MDTRPFSEWSFTCDDTSFLTLRIDLLKYVSLYWHCPCVESLSSCCVQQAEKKPKKAAVNDSIDMKDHAQRGLLGQVNIPTLQYYLRKNGVIVQAKDRKPDLIAKIYRLLDKEKENQEVSNQAV